jgi:hypothetical protein
MVWTGVFERPSDSDFSREMLIGVDFPREVFGFRRVSRWKVVEMQDFGRQSEKPVTFR